jgi:hypothetical protein
METAWVIKTIDADTWNIRDWFGQNEYPEFQKRNNSTRIGMKKRNWDKTRNGRQTCNGTKRGISCFYKLYEYISYKYIL